MRRRRGWAADCLAAVCGWLVWLGLLPWLAAPSPVAASSAIFGGGPFYTGGTAVMNALRASGYSTVMLWTLHVDETSGNLIYNDQLVVANGVYVGTAAWTNQLKTLKTAPTSVNRIEWSVASWGVDDFGRLKTLMGTYGTNTSSIVYRNFLALKNATGADAIDYDDEAQYDTNTAVKFGLMLSSIGYKVTLCPYTQPAFWQNVYTQLGSNIVDAVYLQCYSGGVGNDPVTWNAYFSGLKVQPGLWCKNGDCTSGSSASDVLAQMTNWRSSAGITGGFMWLYDDMLSCSSGGTPADYAAAINQAVEPLGVAPMSGFSGVTAYNQRWLPTATLLVLTNAGPSTVSWSVINTSSWLTVSATLGTNAADGISNVVVSLNPVGATNLALGSHTANVIFSNRATKVAASRSFSLNTAVVNWPVALSGYNAAILASNTATAGTPTATAFDLPNNYCFYQQGLAGSTRGLPLSGVLGSQSDAATAFQVGPYGAADALLLGDTHAKSGTLKLSNADAYNTLAILAVSANGGGQGSFVLNFSDGTKSPALAYNCQDWFYVVTNVVVQGFGRQPRGLLAVERSVRHDCV